MALQKTFRYVRSAATLSDFKNQLLSFQRKMISEGLPYQRYLEWRDQWVYHTPQYKRMQKKHKDQLDAMFTFFWDQLYWEHLEYRHFYNGKWILGKDVPDCEWSKLEGKGAHRWKVAEKFFDEADIEKWQWRETSDDASERKI